MKQKKSSCFSGPFFIYMFACLLMITIITPQVAFGAELPAGKIIHQRGLVEYSTEGTSKWSKANQLMELSEGSCVRVGKGGQAALMLKDRSQIRLQAGSTFCLGQAGSAPQAKKKKKGLYELIIGSLWFRNKRKGPKPMFKTSVVTASIRGTEMALTVEADGKTNVTVLEGTVLCDNAQGSAAATRGQALITEPDGKPLPIALVNPEDAVQWLLLTPEIIGPGDIHLETQANQAVQTAQKAMKHLARADLDTALTLALQAVEMDPNRAAVHVALATVLQAQGLFEKGLKEARTAMAIDPKSIPALVRLTELLYGMDMQGEAQKHLAAFDDKSDPRIALLQGYTSLMQLDTAKAELSFRQAISQAPDLSPAYLGLGLTLYRQGKKALGLIAMEQASLLNPLAAYPHNYMAKAQYELGERHEAEIELKRAIQLDPHDPSPHLYLAALLADQFRSGEGVAALQHSIRLNDNRLMTRSRFLLDQDRAIKNISLAWSLSRLGLHKWARSRGDLAVWDDPANSAAYLFRLAESVSLNQVGAASLGDDRRARLLQPVNANTYLSYTDYYSLLEQPQWKGTIDLRAGTDKTTSSQASLSGGKEQVAVFAAGSFQTTAGPISDSASWGPWGVIRSKTALSPNHEVLLELRANHLHWEDSLPYSDGLTEAKLQDHKLDSMNGVIGYHWRQPKGNHLLTTFQLGDRDGDTLFPWPQSYIKTVEQHSEHQDWRLEGLEMFHLANHRLLLGAAWEEGRQEQDLTYSFPDYFGEPPTSLNINERSEEQRLYFEDTIPFGNLLINGGLQWCRLEGVWVDLDGKDIIQRQFLPHIGMVLPIKDNIFRSAYFEEMQPNLLSGTIQPTEVAGFQRITGTTPGAMIYFSGLGWDRQWNDKTFSRIELYRKDRNYPKTFSPHSDVHAWRDETTRAIELGVERLLTSNLALALHGSVYGHESDSPNSERIDTEMSARLTWINKNGWRTQGTLWYLDQDVRTGYDQSLGDNFVISSLSVEKSFWQKKGLIAFRWENIGNQKYHYLLREIVDRNQLPWQGELAEIIFQWTF